MGKITINSFVKKYKERNKFSYISDEVLKKNLYGFLGYISFLFNSIQNTDDEDKKHFLSHTVIIYLGSLIEAVVFYYANTKLTDKKSQRKYLELLEYKKVQDIRSTDLIICKIERKNQKLDDSINFNNLINGLKDKKIISDELIEKIHHIRRMRNFIHINVLIQNDEKELLNELGEIFENTKEVLDFIEQELKET